MALRLRLNLEGRMTISIPMTVRQWTYLDAVLDSFTSMAAQNGGDPDEIDVAMSVREVGWTFATGNTDVNSGWPPDSDVISIGLEPEQWRLAKRIWDDRIANDHDTTGRLPEVEAQLAGVMADVGAAIEA